MGSSLGLARSSWKPLAWLVLLTGCGWGPEAWTDLGGTPLGSDPSDPGHEVLKNVPGAGLGASGSEAGTTVAVFEFIELSEAEVHWDMEVGWSVARIKVVGDVTGDGLSDSIVSIGNMVVSQTVLVASPLHRDLTLPRDATATFETSFLDVGDATGDGQLDVIAHDKGTLKDYLLVPPLVGAIDTVASGIPLVGWEHVDINGDGTLDLVETPVDQVANVTWGPYERWGGAARPRAGPLV